MKQLYVFIFCLCVLLNSALPVAYSQPNPDQQALQAALETFRDAYSSEIVMGTPLEVNDLKIIPLATVGIGFGPSEPGAETVKIGGTGGLLMPVGVIVVSGQDVRIVQISKGFVEQLVGALAPVLLEHINFPQRETQDSISEGEAVVTPHAPKQGSFSITYWKFAVIFWLIWFVFAFIIQKFLPDKISTIGTAFRYNLIPIGLLGLLGYGILFFLAIIFTISIIGIPFTFALLILTGILTLFGTIGFAFFIGQESATAFKYHYSDSRFLLIGGVLFGLLGMIPGIGVIVWALIAVLGLGVIIQMQQESLRKR